MNQRVRIRHSTGSKASIVEEFPAVAGKELTFGRDPACDVRFDNARDEFVSRRHMKLVVGDPGQAEFTVVELSARNGTFVNRKRVRGSAPLHPGDLVQLGAGGPEFVFDVATEDLKVTPPSELPVPEATPEPPSDAVARQPTVPIPHKDVRQHAKRPSRKKRFAAMAVALAGIAVAVVYGLGTGKLGRVGSHAAAVLERGRGLVKFSPALAPDEIGRQNAPSLVTVGNTWRLVDRAGTPIRQIYIPNRRDDGSVLVPGAGSVLPVFVLLGPGRVQPLLTVAEHSEYRAIAGAFQAAGFALADGLVLTTLACSRPWTALYHWPAADTAGIVAVFTADHKLDRTAVIARRQFPPWRPVDTEFVLGAAFDPNSAAPDSRIRGLGKSDALAVHSSAGKLAVSVAEVSEETGMATIRLADSAVFAPIPPISDTPAKVGDRLTYILMPERRGATLEVAGILPDGRYALRTGFARLHAGAPLFDKSGRVVAVQAEHDPARPDRPLAVPIRRALESVGIKPGV